MNMERRWKQTIKRGKQKYSDKRLSQFKVCHSQSQMDGAVPCCRQPNHRLRHCKAITSAV